jgi:hypothetical protein
MTSWLCVPPGSELRLHLIIKVLPLPRKKRWGKQILRAEIWAMDAGVTFF